MKWFRVWIIRLILGSVFELYLIGVLCHIIMTKLYFPLISPLLVKEQNRVDLHQLAQVIILSYYSANKCYSDPVNFVIITRIIDSYVSKILGFLYFKSFLKCHEKSNLFGHTDLQKSSQSVQLIYFHWR